LLLSRIEGSSQPAAESVIMGGGTNSAWGGRRNQIMESVDKGEVFNISGSCNDNRIDHDYPEVVQSIGAALAFVVVILGWAINKIFRRDLM
jgi:hypothetical protein